MRGPFRLQCDFAVSRGLRRGGVSMAPTTWRENDKRRRQAIHRFVDVHKDELLKEIPKNLLKNSASKRNELVRVGRVRFARLSPRVQASFLAQVSEPSTPSGRAGSGHELAAIVEARGCDVAKSLGAPATSTDGSGPAANGGASDNLQKEAKTVQVKRAIEAQLPFLRKLFPGASVFDVLASATRLADELAEDLYTQTVSVTVAICLGFGAKLACVGKSHNFAIWGHIVGAKGLPHLKKIEVRVVNAWGRRGAG